MGSLPHRLSLAFVVLTLTGCAQHIPAPTAGLAPDLLKRWAAPHWDGEGKLHVPGPDAPDDEVLAFWTGDIAESGGTFEAGNPEVPPGTNISLTPQRREQLLRAALAEPRYLSQVLRKIPDTPGARESVYETYLKMQAAQFADLPEEWHDEVHDWLMHHGYFHEELIAAAKLAAFRDSYLSHEDDLKALVQLDWPAASSILQDFAHGKDLHLSAAADALLHEHARHENSADADAWRAALQKIAADSTAPAFARDCAFEVLLAESWAGKDDWFISLFNDATLNDLHEGYMGYYCPLNAWAQRFPQPDPRLIQMLASEKKDVRTNAAVALFETGDSDATALLITHRDAWPPKFERRIVARLSVRKIPGTIPFLLDYYTRCETWERWDAAMALARADAPNARNLILGYFDHPEDIGDRSEFVDALTQTKALSISQLAGLLAGDLWPDFSEPHTGAATFDPWLIPDLDQRSGLSDWLIARLHGDLRPKVAEQIWSNISHWPAPAIDAEIARRLVNGSLDQDLIELALNRPTLAARQFASLDSLARSTGERAGIAAAVLNDTATSRRILAGLDGPAIQMLLACTRLKNGQLPLNAVAPLLSSSDPQLARAAEAFLLVDDSPEAQRLVRQHHAGDLIIIGSGQIFPDPNPPSPGIIIRHPTPEDLRLEMLAPNPPDEIFALFSGGGWGGDGQRIIRIRGTRATYSYDIGEFQPLTRELTAAQLQSLRDFITSRNIDSLPPLQNDAVFDGISYNYVHLTPKTGRILTINNPGVAGTGGTPYDLLTRRFRALTPPKSPQTSNKL